MTAVDVALGRVALSATDMRAEVVRLTLENNRLRRQLDADVETMGRQQGAIAFLEAHVANLERVLAEVRAPAEAGAA